MAPQQTSTAAGRVEPPALPDGSRWPASQHRMSLGLMVPIFEASAFGGTPRFSDMLEITRAAADAGFEVAWFADHFSAPAEEGETPRGVWECFTTIAGLAAATSDLSINLGTLVACTGFRNPGVLAKMTESIDEISGGRFILGLGAGWHEPEYDMFGMPFDHRVSRFEDAVVIVTDLLREGSSSREGRFFQTAEALNRPRGPRAASGGPPVLIGTSGERMLRITARYADAWNTVWHPSADDAIPKLSALEGACRDVGRDFASIVKTAGGNIALEGCHNVRPNPMRGTVSELADAITAFHGLGFDHFVCGLDPCTVESVRDFSEVISAIERRLS
ncbi:MAG TPA: LLM class flavin-dependent oxidoreductase [Thermomicrobiales bacterium]|nr:LLM class flavin-dependent oxidoreductase [Thermomicrobiales bacterium]